jgi:hypothetical protein
MRSEFVLPSLAWVRGRAAFAEDLEGALKVAIEASEDIGMVSEVGIARINASKTSRKRGS